MMAESSERFATREKQRVNNVPEQSRRILLQIAVTCRLENNTQRQPELIHKKSRRKLNKKQGSKFFLKQQKNKRGNNKITIKEEAFNLF